MTTKIFTDRKEPRGNDRVFKHFNILGVKFRVAIKERAYRRKNFNVMAKRTYLTKNIYYTSMGISYDGIDSKLYTLYWRQKMKIWSGVITYSVLDMGRECETKEEYIELVKDYFREEHNLEILENEISDIEFEETENENI